MSDILNEYAKIAIAKGLISEAKAKEEKTNPRYDSLDLEAIEMLYGVKPNGEEKHIVEQAHPEPVIVSPAYDRVNGLVENLLERQDVMHYIATKPNHGKHIQERYVKAHNELLNEVIKTAFVLDRDEHGELMQLADSCSERLVKKGFWAALAKYGPMIWNAVKLLLPAIGIINHFGGDIDKGVVMNADRSIEALNTVKADVPDFSDAIDNLINQISHVKDLNEELTAKSIDVSVEGLEEKAKEANSLLVVYAKAIKELSKNIKEFSKEIKPIDPKETTIEEYLGETGIVVEKAKELIFSDSTSKVITILKTLDESLSDSIETMNNRLKGIKQSSNDDNMEELEELLSVPQNDTEVELKEAV